MKLRARNPHTSTSSMAVGMKVNTMARNTMATLRVPVHPNHCLAFFVVFCVCIAFWKKLISLGVLRRNVHLSMVQVALWVEISALFSATLWVLIGASVTGKKCLSLGTSVVSAARMKAKTMAPEHRGHAALSCSPVPAASAFSLTE